MSLVERTLGTGFAFLCFGLLLINAPNAQILDQMVRSEVSPSDHKLDKTHKFCLRDVQAQLRPISDLQQECGPRIGLKPQGPLTPKFLRSSDVQKETFLDVVKISFENEFGKKDFCTGVLVTPKLVLTAAHCSCGKISSYKIFRRRDEEKNKDGKHYYVLAWEPFRYANYLCALPAARQPGRDLALLPIELITSIQARGPSSANFDNPTNVLLALLADSLPRKINIATMHEVYTDRAATKSLIGAGYGLTETGVPKELKQAAIPIGSFFCGANRFAGSLCYGFREFVLADTLVPSGRQRSDSCGGDSGAPIVWQPPPEWTTRDRKQPTRREVMLVGITSRALSGVRHDPGTTCGGGGIYTAVGHPDVIEWLRSFGIQPWTAFDYRDKKDEE